jgi:2-Cys peroxiredoxin 5
MVFVRHLDNITVHEDNPGNKVTTEQLFKGKKVVIFGVPGNIFVAISHSFLSLSIFVGAFTPGCHKTHLPGYVSDCTKFKDKGVNDILCISVNDAFVCDAWKQASNANGKVRVIADTNAELTKALGLDLDLTGALGGIRSKRYSAYVDDGVIKCINVESDGTGLTCSLSNNLLSQI